MAIAERSQRVFRLDLARLGAPVLGLLAALALSIALARDSGFDQWLARLRHEAVSRGISPQTLDEALQGVSPIPRVLELDRQQPEFTLTFEQYLERVAPQSRIDDGRRLLAENRALLVRISRRYGVQPRFIVALWGIESDFGRRMGSFPVVGALATLAYDGRRSAYFRRELMDALQILDAGHVRPHDMVGSWAGAMGQGQFMPSSFRRYAVDYDGDGRKDIWGSRADALASIASYLSGLGWRSGEPWGREVRLPPGFDRRPIGKVRHRTLQQWRALGVRAADGSELANSQRRAVLIRPDGRGGRVFLVFSNWHSLMRWNRSTYFATAVGYLADRIAQM